MSCLCDPVTPSPANPPIHRIKMLMTTARPHSRKDAEKAGGMGEPDNGRKLRSAGPADMDE